MVEDPITTPPFFLIYRNQKQAEMVVGLTINQKDMIYT